MTNKNRNSGRGRAAAGKSAGGLSGAQIYAIIVSLILAACIAFAAISYSVGWWQLTPEAESGTGGEQEKEESNFIVGGEDVAGGISLYSAGISSANYADYGISELAESAVTLTANVQPDYATGYEDSDITWTATWQNGGTGWAADRQVSDYVSLSASTGQTVAVSCLQGFSVPVTITAALPEYDLSATRQCDYQAEWVYADTTASGTITVPAGGHNREDNSTGTITVLRSLARGEGTIEPEFSEDTYESLVGEPVTFNLSLDKSELACYDEFNMSNSGYIEGTITNVSFAYDRDVLNYYMPEDVNEENEIIYKGNTISFTVSVALQEVSYTTFFEGSDYDAYTDITASRLAILAESLSEVGSNNRVAAWRYSSGISDGLGDFSNVDGFNAGTGGTVWLNYAAWVAPPDGITISGGGSGNIVFNR